MGYCWAREVRFTGTTVLSRCSSCGYCLDITRPESFSKAQYWVKELQKHGIPNIVMALVGNKAYLHDKREVPVQDGIDYAERNGMLFIETSAKTADNIDELFEVIKRAKNQGKIHILRVLCTRNRLRRNHAKDKILKI